MFKHPSAGPLEPEDEATTILSSITDCQLNIKASSSITLKPPATSLHYRSIYPRFLLRIIIQKYQPYLRSSETLRMLLGTLKIFYCMIYNASLSELPLT
jgi:hypothetical protein